MRNSKLQNKNMVDICMAYLWNQIVKTSFLCTKLVASSFGISGNVQISVNNDPYR